MKLQILCLLVSALVAATAARGFPTHYRSEAELQQYREELMGARPTAADQSHTQHEQATTMARDVTSIGINKPLQIGQTIEVEYMSPSSGRVYVQLETANNEVVLVVDSRYDWLSYEKVFLLNTFRAGRWETELFPTGFPFPCSGVTTMITLSITVESDRFLISANGVVITEFMFRGSLTPDQVVQISCIQDDYGADALSQLKKMSVSY